MISLENLLINNVTLLFGLGVVLIFDLILKSYKLYLNNIYILLSFIIITICLSYLQSAENKNLIIFHNLLISILLFITYDFFLIGIFFESPTLTIIKKIYNSKNLKFNYLKKIFLNEKFVAKRISELKIKNYITQVGKKLIYTKKNLLLIKFMQIVQRFQNIKDKKNG